MFSLVENEGTTKTLTETARPGRRSKAISYPAPAQHEKHHAGERQHHQHLAVEVPAVEAQVWQHPGRQTGARAHRGGGANVRFQGSAASTNRSAARVRGHEVAWGSDTGGQHEEEIQEVRGKGRPYTPLDRPLPAASTGLGADTAVSIEREVVSGHAYAIPAPPSRLVRQVRT